MLKPIWPGWPRVAFTALFFLLLAPAAESMLLLPTINTDTPLKFVGSVDYKGPLTFSEIVFDNNPATPGPASVNWRIVVRQARVDSPAPSAANDIEVSAIHLITPPAPAHGEGQGGLVEVADFLNVTPGTTVFNNQGDVDIHAFSRTHGQHRDVLQARIDAIDGATSRISIQADHTSGPDDPPPVLPQIPEPSTLALLALGLAGLGATRLRSR